VWRSISPLIELVSGTWNRGSLSRKFSLWEILRRRTLPNLCQKKSNRLIDVLSLKFFEIEALHNRSATLKAVRLRNAPYNFSNTLCDATVFTVEMLYDASYENGYIPILMDLTVLCTAALFARGYDSECSPGWNSESWMIVLGVTYIYRRTPLTDGDVMNKMKCTHTDCTGVHVHALHIRDVQIPIRHTGLFYLPNQHRFCDYKCSLEQLSVQGWVWRRLWYMHTLAPRSILLRSPAFPLAHIRIHWCMRVILHTAHPHHRWRCFFWHLHKKSLQVSQILVVIHLAVSSAKAALIKTPFPIASAPTARYWFSAHLTAFLCMHVRVGMRTYV